MQLIYRVEENVTFILFIYVIMYVVDIRQTDHSIFRCFGQFFSVKLDIDITIDVFFQP